MTDEFKEVMSKARRMFLMGCDLRITEYESQITRILDVMLPMEDKESIDYKDALMLLEYYREEVSLHTRIRSKYVEA